MENLNPGQLLRPGALDRQVATDSSNGKGVRHDENTERKEKVLLAFFGRPSRIYPRLAPALVIHTDVDISSNDRYR